MAVVSNQQAPIEILQQPPSASLLAGKRDGSRALRQTGENEWPRRRPLPCPQGNPCRATARGTHRRYLAALKIHLLRHPRAEAPPRGRRTLPLPGGPSRASLRAGADFREEIQRGQLRLPIGEIMAVRMLRHAVPGSGTSRMSRAVPETPIGRIGKTPEAVGSASEDRLRSHSNHLILGGRAGRANLSARMAVRLCGC